MKGTSMFETLENRELYSVSTDTNVLKTPGPTNTVVIVATNPAGNQVPGQSSVIVVSNKDSKAFR